MKLKHIVPNLHSCPRQGKVRKHQSSFGHPPKRKRSKKRNPLRRRAGCGRDPKLPGGLTTGFPTGFACRMPTALPTPQGRGQARGHTWKTPMDNASSGRQKPERFTSPVPWRLEFRYRYIFFYFFIFYFSGRKQADISAYQSITKETYHHPAETLLEVSLSV